MPRNQDDAQHVGPDYVYNGVPMLSLTAGWNRSEDDPLPLGDPDNPPATHPYTGLTPVFDPATKQWGVPYAEAKAIAEKQSGPGNFGSWLMSVGGMAAPVVGALNPGMIPGFPGGRATEGVFEGATGAALTGAETAATGAGAFEGAAAAGAVETAEGATGAMDMFGSLNSPLGTGAGGTVFDLWDAMAPAAGAATTGALTGVSPLAVEPFIETGAMDMFGSLNSPLGTGAGGTVFDAMSNVGAGQGLTDKIIQWAKNNQLLAATGVNVAGGLIRGAMAPTPRDVARAQTDEAIRLLNEKRRFGQFRNINTPMRPTGAMLRQSGVPGLLTGATR